MLRVARAAAERVRRTWTGEARVSLDYVGQHLGGHGARCSRATGGGRQGLSRVSQTGLPVEAEGMLDEDPRKNTALALLGCPASMACGSEPDLKG